MKERPILFNGAMVRAILEGRKTQTRRICKQAIRDGMPEPEWNSLLSCCPFGQPGNRLWVRETWQGPLLDSEEQETQFHDDGPEAFKKTEFCAYRATDKLDAIDDDGKEIGWRPSIHMPRWASRINLEITGVRIERLNDISEADAIAEGAKPFLLPVHPAREGLRHVDGFSILWESINGPESWGANPWVWVVEFKQAKLEAST